MGKGSKALAQRWKVWYKTARSSRDQLVRKPMSYTKGTAGAYIQTVATQGCKHNDNRAAQFSRKVRKLESLQYFIG